MSIGAMAYDDPRPAQLRAVALHVKIGGVSRQLGLTPRALRLYEEMKLIEVERDSLGRRLYDRDARERLWWIAKLRTAGMPLSEIRCILDAPDTMRSHEAVSRLESRLNALRAQTADIEAIVAALAPSAEPARARRP